jgi:ubiquinone/menaquinone biosynthesis C-methylase UbiE
MRERFWFSERSVIADVGCGTGILAELFLRNGNSVFGVEPNEDMRTAAEARLVSYRSFRSINGSAESTTLPNASVDFITAAQSFHWFQPKETGREFRRILRPSGWVVLIWNTRKTTTPFLQGYEELVSWVARERKNRVKHEDLGPEAISEFLGKHEETKLESSQRLDLEALVGRLMSASYSPLPGEPLHPELVRMAEELFERYQRNGFVELEYWTEVYASQLMQ